MLPGLASAAVISLSLNLAFNDPGNFNSGGSWTIVAKADERGIAGIALRLEASTINFNAATGFLTPVGFEVADSNVFGAILEILEADDLSDPTLDVGVIGGSYPSTYVDDPNLVLFGANPDLGAFSGGVELATGSFDPGVVPSWYDDGSTASRGNLFDSSISVIGPITANTTIRYLAGSTSLDPPQQIELGAIPVEYSNTVDEQGVPAGGHGLPDPGQTLYTEAPDSATGVNPRDALDVFPLVESGTSTFEQVDALAYGNDALIDELLANSARLVISVEGDSGGAEIAAYSENPDGTVDVYLAHGDLDANDSRGGLENVDALELWGPVGVEDGDYYSLQGDATNGTSIYLRQAGTTQSFVAHAEIIGAVESLGYAGEPDLIDVDALMVRNVDTPETFEAGDVVLFSIRAVPAAGFSGQEIIVLPAGGPARFLEHGGHDWDPSFVFTGVDGGTADVDALEAAPLATPVPASTIAGRILLIVTLGGFAALQTRQSRRIDRTRGLFGLSATRPSRPTRAPGRASSSMNVAQSREIIASDRRTRSNQVAG